MVDARVVTNIVDQKFSRFGPNKRQEVTRLLYEIAKKEKSKINDILAQAPEDAKFTDLKKYLVQRRFPAGAQKRTNARYMFPKLEIDPELKVDTSRKLDLIPKHFIIENAVESSELAQQVRQEYPQAKFTITDHYRNHRKERYEIRDYNNRLQEFYLVKEDYDFLKHCPCSTDSVHCNYHVINLGSGCGFECTYCYLQDYINSPGIVIPANIEDFFQEFEKHQYIKRLGSGELTDSLIFDHITGFSLKIVDFFRQYSKTMFEFKTKSNNIGNLLKIKPGNNIIVSWSVNPQVIIESTEHHTASLQERLDAAVQCMDAGYKLAFHFDPMIHYPGWEKDYRDLVNRIYDVIDPSCLEWVSVGTLRMTPRLKRIIENRFTNNTILDEEFLLSYDGKLRYSFDVRTRMYKQMKKWIRDRDKNVYLYLCMEEKDACGTCETGPIIKKK